MGATEIGKGKEGMLKSFAIVFSALTICLALSAFAAPPSEPVQKLYTTSHANFAAEFTVPLNAIRSPANAWDSASQQLPRNLAEYVRAAQVHLLQTRELSAPLRLLNINIRPIDIRAENDQDFVRRNYLAIEFQSSTPDKKPVGAAELTEIILVDGTFATMTITKGQPAIPVRQPVASEGSAASKDLNTTEEHARPKSVSNSPDAGDSGTSAPGKELLYDLPPSLPNRISFEFRVDRSALERPANSWDPGSEPLAMDLRTCIQRAQDHLLLKRQIPGKLQLTSVLITRHFSKEPTELMRKRGKQWEVITRFVCEKADGTNVADDELYVVSLLDGTIADETLRSGELVLPFR
jgi:hypothetical protein